MDAAGTLSLRPHLENPYEDTTATININVNYLEAADAEEDVVATGEVARAGGSVGVASMTAEQGDDLIAVGQGAYRLFGAGGSGR
jgi:acyl-coenzyme A thioesterase PaaI-like protein